VVEGLEIVGPMNSRLLVSGAGHDGVVIASVTDIAVAVG
jgi:hypothetical protein